MYSNNKRSSSKSKHVEIKFLVVKERVKRCQMFKKHYGTNSMIVDSLTKGFPPKDFHKHIAHIGVQLLDDMQF